MDASVARSPDYMPAKCTSNGSERSPRRSGCGPTAKSRPGPETSDAGWIVLQNPVVFIDDRRPEVWVAGLSPFRLPRPRHGLVTQLLHWASSCRRWWVTPEQL